MSPQRIQRQRIRGWRKPPNTVYVGRGSMWGNPFQVGYGYTRAEAVDAYRNIATIYQPRTEHPLRGKNLMCWCPLYLPCHADVLLEIANG